MHTDEYTREAFTCGDCWALALELKARFPHLTVCTLIDPYWDEDNDPEAYDFMQWTHAVVLDKDTGTYYDVLGAHRPEDNFPDWEMFDWTEIYDIPDEALDEYFKEEKEYGRLYEDVPLSEGVRLATLDTAPLTAVA